MWNLYNFKLRFLSAFIGIAPVQFVPPALPTELRRNMQEKEIYSVSFSKDVGYELFSRAVSSQVSLPLQRLTSVFGMGTGGPTVFITLTNRFLGLVHLRGLEPRTH